MLYLIAFQYAKGQVLALTNKGQFIGSPDLNEATQMLPSYNLYTQDDEGKKREATPYEFAFRAHIVKVDSLKNAFMATKGRGREDFKTKTLYFTWIKEEFNYIFKQVTIKTKSK